PPRSKATAITARMIRSFSIASSWRRQGLRSNDTIIAHTMLASITILKAISAVGRALRGALNHGATLPGAAPMTVLSHAREADLDGLRQGSNSLYSLRDKGVLEG